MALVTPDDVKILVRTKLEDADLIAIIEREEADVIRRFGPHATGPDGEVTETFTDLYSTSIWLSRRAASVTSVTEEGVLLVENTGYRVWADQGRLQRLYAINWYGTCVVVYVPGDDGTERKSVIIELVRIALERSAMRSESFQGEYSYQAPDWEVERVKILRRLSVNGLAW